jgi:hypothetical protein
VRGGNRSSQNTLQFSFEKKCSFFRAKKKQGLEKNDCFPEEKLFA